MESLFFSVSLKIYAAGLLSLLMSLKYMPLPSLIFELVFEVHCSENMFSVSILSNGIESHY